MRKNLQLKKATGERSLMAHTIAVYRKDLLRSVISSDGQPPGQMPGKKTGTTERIKPMPNYELKSKDKTFCRICFILRK